MASATFDEILKRSTVDGFSNVYILGNNAKKVTFHAQQRRAFNLIWALFKAGKLKQKDTVAIIGGGLAGMTAAVAAKAKKCIPTIYEQSQSLLPLWSSNSHRFIHPNIYEWPKAGSDEELTRLPALNWQAGFAKDVAKQVMNEWELNKDGITEAMPKIVSQLSQSGNKIKVLANPYDLEPYDCVILAMGFGIEETHGIVNASTYWEGDNLDSIPAKVLGSKKKILITGCGDGGLIDALRLSLNNFDHEDFSKSFLNHPSFESVKKTIIEAEENFKKMDAATACEEIFATYKSLATGNLAELLKGSLKQTTEVWLNSDSLTPLTPQSSVHNRVLVSLLIKLNKINFISGRANNYKLQDDGTYKVDIMQSNGVNKECHVDMVIVRHGPKGILKALLGPNFTIPSNDEPDPTSEKLWADSFYSTLPNPTLNQRKYMNEHIGTLYEAIGETNYDETVGIKTRNNIPHYRIQFLQTAPEHHLEHLKEHKGYPILLERINEIITPQNGTFKSSYDYRDPVLKVGAPISNRMNHSIGSQNFGTLGCFVINANGQLACLSTSHVLRSTHYLNVNDVDLLYDPNQFRFMKYEAIGKLRNIVPMKYQPAEQISYHFNDRLKFNQMDAGMVVIDTKLPRPVYQKAMDFVRMDGILPGMRVKKFGAGSGATVGEVTAVSCRIKVTFDEGVAVFNDVFEVKGIHQSFSTVGDSGALVVSNDNRAMGMIFAGNDEVTYVCPIEPILVFFRCRIIKIED